MVWRDACVVCGVTLLRAHLNMACEDCRGTMCGRCYEEHDAKTCAEITTYITSLLANPLPDIELSTLPVTTQ